MRSTLLIQISDSIKCSDNKKKSFITLSPEHGGRFEQLLFLGQRLAGPESGQFFQPGIWRLSPALSAGLAPVQARPLLRRVHSVANVKTLFFDISDAPAQ
jgi:hypothetical protein